ncbi:MAG: nucleotidyltransferase domain-containing protein [Planctomycetes bacterium]|nr:nucleotidyltransferase domain-containing protein [Planctomycetota bacterium]
MNKFGLKDSVFQSILDVFKSHPEVTQAAFFGSRAMGNFKPNSDIDIVLWGQIDQTLLGRIYSQLEDLSTPYMFDVKVYGQVTHPPVIEHIDTHAVVIYNKTS